MNTVLMFSTTTCNPCKQMKDVMNQVDHTTKAHLQYLDARYDAEQVARFGIRSVPTLIMLDQDDEIIKTKVGRMNLVEYEAWLE